MGDDPDAGPSEPGEREAVEKWKRELEQRERGLDDFADELDDRELELEENAAELRDRRAQLDEREAELDDREARIAERETELDDRETAITERERELSERADELDEKERTLEEYVTDNVHEAVQSAASETMKRYRTSRRFGTIGSLVLALVGVTLIVGGVLYGFGDEIARVPLLFNSDGANLGVTVLLLFSGLAANLAAVAD
jgi:ribonuclease Y